jgi:hypothetical protein
MADNGAGAPRRRVLARQRRQWRAILGDVQPALLAPWQGLAIRQTVTGSLQAGRGAVPVPRPAAGVPVPQQQAASTSQGGQQRQGSLAPGVAPAVTTSTQQRDAQAAIVLGRMGALAACGYLETMEHVVANATDTAAAALGPQPAPGAATTDAAGGSGASSSAPVAGGLTADQAAAAAKAAATAAGSPGTPATVPGAHPGVGHQHPPGPGCQGHPAPAVHRHVA